ncbi:eEF1A lysine and N-terminal methyltransferase homolog [Lucilia cuprina]|uniref:eEF1A lysine and N-terminal methyltransferase homolog n=1 Tax=Lucilia cuprina TaxID=7375 RepID=UPI001F058C55|nr:eEF1A lysine and N-terminal methyltransferase homolog [Lucilia cuprina]
MNLLPKSHEEFAQTDYWNAFFKKRGEKAFEWYGEYLELCEQIHKYVKSNDKILMLGCGNSKLSMDMYDSGYKNIVNIDISAVAIKKMQEINSRTRSDMKFLQMDATQMSFENEQFSVAFDKGTLDALFVDDTPEVRDTVEKYFKEVSRVLRTGGRYICISLLQEHILKYVIEYFPKNSFMLRIVQCLDAQKANQEKNADNPDAVSMPVFALVATKFKALPMPILEFSFSSDKIQRLNSTQELENAVASVQRAALVCNGLARSNIAGHNEVTMELCKPGETSPRYTIHILDQPPARGFGKYAAFIVPQGREIEWLFSTTEGRKKLQASAKFQRMAVVTLHRDQVYESLDAVKAELSENVKSLAPLGLKEQIPFLSLGSDVGKRETIVCGFSKISGDFRVEEVEDADGRILRRLVFLNNQFVVQSEALVKTIKTKDQKLERKIIDIGYLACQHHLYMSVGVQLATAGPVQNNELKNVLVVGLGGGGLCSFLHAALPNVCVTAVEIDPMMLEVAEQHFDLKQDKRLNVVIDDGLAFLQNCKNEGIKYDAVLFDVDSKDLSLGMSCPPPTFLADTVLSNITSIIGDKGLFILNLVCRDETLRANALESMKKVFPSICTYKLDEDINEVVYCTNNSKLTNLKNWKKLMGSAGRNLNTAVKSKKLNVDDMLDVTEFMNDLKL